MKNALHPRLRIFAAILLLLFGSLVPGFFYIRVQNRIARQTNNKLNEVTAAHVYELTHRLEAYTNVLYSTRGLFAATEVDDAVWDRFISNQSLTKRYPGMQAAAYAEVVPQDQANSFEKRMQAQFGAENFTIHPRKDSGDYVIITFHKETSAQETSQGSMGMDIASDDLRRTALSASQKIGDITATAPLELRTLHKTGFILVTPVKNVNGKQSDKPIGYAIAIFDVENLVSASMAERLHQYKTSMTISDVTDGKENVFYKLAYPNSEKTLKSSTTVDIGGRQWKVTYNTPASDLVMFDDRAAPYLMIGVSALVVAFISLATYTVRQRRLLIQRLGTDK
jgi:CHASE1-domain containing sensor protein